MKNPFGSRPTKPQVKQYRTCGSFVWLQALRGRDVRQYQVFLQCKGEPRRKTEYLILTFIVIGDLINNHNDDCHENNSS